MQKPTTLGEKLLHKAPEKQPTPLKLRLILSLLSGLNAILLIAMCGLAAVWFLGRSDGDKTAVLALLGVLCVMWIVVFLRRRSLTAPQKSTLLQRRQHPLLSNDRQGFMRHLRLDAKTVIFDGSNIYHFGHANGLDAQVLGMIADQLRTEGYRVVCFFDSNIFYTLNEHGAFPKKERHNLALLTDIFGLESNEIYVVPSGEQADGYVLNSLKHLPISFAVSNDQYRDYGKKFASVMKGDQWRKGVSISKNEIKLHKHKFRSPLRLV